MTHSPATGPTKLNRFWALGLALLILAGCGQSVAVGERFTLRDGEMVRVKQSEVTIEARQIIDGLDGSQEIGDGSVSLRVTVEDGDEIELCLEAGGTAATGGYEIHFERVVADADGLTCEVVVTRR